MSMETFAKKLLKLFTLLVRLKKFGHSQPDTLYVYQ